MSLCMRVRVRARVSVCVFVKAGGRGLHLVFTTLPRVCSLMGLQQGVIAGGHMVETLASAGSLRELPGATARPERQQHMGRHRQHQPHCGWLTAWRRRKRPRDGGTGFLSLEGVADSRTFTVSFCVCV